MYVAIDSSCIQVRGNICKYFYESQAIETAFQRVEYHTIICFLCHRISSSWCIKLLRAIEVMTFEPLKMLMVLTDTFHDPGRSSKIYLFSENIDVILVIFTDIQANLKFLDRYSR